MKKCIVCGGDVNLSLVYEEFWELFMSVDMFGYASIEDVAQAVTSGRICSFNCFEKLEDGNHEEVCN